ncbi:MAG: nitroreductase, partial [Acidithiobacillales bacterium SM23_46]
WIGAFSEPQAKEVLGIPEHIRVVELLTLGYPATQPGARSRKAIEEIVCYDKWSLG